MPTLLRVNLIAADDDTAVPVTTEDASPAASLAALDRFIHWHARQVEIGRELRTRIQAHATTTPRNAIPAFASKEDDSMADQDETKKDDDITITMKFRGSATAVVDALVNGLPREALMDFHAALDREMAKRSRTRRETWPTRPSAQGDGDHGEPQPEPEAVGSQK